MTFIKVKIAPKIIPTKKVVEDPLDRTTRERKEKEAKKIKDESDKIKDDLVKKERQANIIRPYLDNLQAQIQEKGIQDFWTFSDRKGFKKFRGSMSKVQKLLKSDIPKYKNRKIAYFTIMFHQNEKEDSLHRKFDIWMNASFTITQIDSKGSMDNPLRTSLGANISWKSDDFKTTKFSLKLIEELMYPVNDKIAGYTSLMGFPVTWVLEDLKKKKIDLSEFCNPLAGV